MPDHSNTLPGFAKPTTARRTVALVAAAVLIAGLVGVGTQTTPEAQGGPKPTAAPITEPPLLDNTLYRAGRVPPVSCQLPNDLLESRAAVLGYARVMVACLDRGWGPMLAHLGFHFYPPSFDASEDPTSSACGPSDDAVAFYCSMNNTIYFDWAQYVSKDRSQQPWLQGAVMEVVAHEYGHHVQELVSIGTYFDDRYEQATGDTRLQDSRRMELQASCFAAAFLGANRQALDLQGERLAGLQDAEYSGDEWGEPRDHGSTKNNKSWTRDAFKSADPGSCNTWTASPERVS
ncbi:MAG TPA: neutral zinc metallopeptidase [Kribbella sp.]